MKFFKFGEDSSSEIVSFTLSNSSSEFIESFWIIFSKVSSSDILPDTLSNSLSESPSKIVFSTSNFFKSDKYFPLHHL